MSFYTAIPSELFECMAMVIPVFHAVEGESVDIVTREDVGLTFEPQNSAASIHVLRCLTDDLALFKRLKTNDPIAAPNSDRTQLAIKMLGHIQDLTEETKTHSLSYGRN